METIRYTSDVKAKKEHRCNFCGEKIRVGETYCISTHKNDGELYDWRTHKHCSDLAVRLRMYDECIEGVTEDDFVGTVSSFHDGLMIEMFQPSEIQKYSDVIQQIRHVNFRDKLRYVIRHFIKIDKQNETVK